MTMSFFLLFSLLFLISYGNILLTLLSGFTLCVALMLNNSKNGNCILVIFLLGVRQASMVFNHEFIVTKFLLCFYNIPIGAHNGL